MPEDTIFALASAPGRAGLQVLRVSGPAVAACLAAFAIAPPPPRQAALRTLRDPGDGGLIDRGLVIRFPAPASYTGEDVLELHLHGGSGVLAAACGVLVDLPGVRPAEPGEFTRRAVLNGKLDLTQAEALADLVDAETRAQTRQALRQLEGRFGRLCEDWRAVLTRALAHLEAAIDFPDEDLPDSLVGRLTADLRAAAAGIAGHLGDDRRGERLREGARIAVIGPPNAGKSSLVNWLSRRDVAIVSDIAGTTRDIIEVHLDLGGWPAVIADTAGLRDSTDGIEREGVRRAVSWAEAADLRVLVLDGARPAPEQAVPAGLLSGRDLVLLNKSDLAPAAAGLPAGLPVSVRTGAGLERFVAMLGEAVAAQFETGAVPVITRLRHREALQSCHAALDRALACLPAGGAAVELAAEELRLAVQALGRITGRVDVEDLLDVIFRDFCIGK